MPDDLQRTNRRRPLLFGSFLTHHLVPASLAFYLFFGFVWKALVVRAGFFMTAEIGHGDSYILYHVLRFVRTGTIYHKLSEPPYLPALYSPFVYLLYSISRYFAFPDIFLAPRLIAFATFLACVWIAVSIARNLIPVRFVWLWAVLMIGSIRPMNDWILQLRGDFIGIFFGLAAIRLLISCNRRFILAAGLCAGIAIQIKFTLLTGAASGFVWLLMRRRLKDAGVFALGTSITSIGLFFFFWLREPNLIPQMTALMPGIKDPGGDLTLLAHALVEPVVLLSLPALPLIVSRSLPKSGQWPRWTLLLIYVITSFGLETLFDLQAGGNINYFFEPLFALIPFAVLGTFHLFSLGSQRPGIALFVAAVVVVQFVIPDGKFVSQHRADGDLAAVRKDNRKFGNLEAALRGQRILSVEPRISLMDPHPAMLEPYLLAYSLRLGRFNIAPLINRISAGEFDVFVSTVETKKYRGLLNFEGADLKAAVSEAFKPYCRIFGDEVQLPRTRTYNHGIEDTLRLAGCRPE